MAAARDVQAIHIWFNGYSSGVVFEPRRCCSSLLVAFSVLALVTTSTWPWPEVAGEASAGQYARMHPSCVPAWLPSSRCSLLFLPWLLGLQHITIAGTASITVSGVLTPWLQTMSTQLA